MMAVSPITTPVPWSMKKRSPISAPGWMSMPVAEWAISAIMRASSGAPKPVEDMREAMVDDGRDAGIAEQHLVDALRGRVAVVGGADVGVEQRAHFRQFLGEGDDDACRAATVGIEQFGDAGAERANSSCTCFGELASARLSSVWPTK